MKKLELNKLKVTTLNTQELQKIAGAGYWDMNMAWIGGIISGIIVQINIENALQNPDALSNAILQLDQSYSYESAGPHVQPAPPMIPLAE